MSLHRYQFEYALSDRLTECPLTLTVTARHYRIAVRRAQCRLKEIVREERAGRWDWHMSGFGLTDQPKAVYTSYHHLRGTLYRGHQLPPPRKPHLWTSADQAVLDKVAQGEGFASYDEAMTGLLKIIEDAPPISDLFKAPLPDIDAPVIPLVYVTPMPRDQWPDRHP